MAGGAELVLRGVSVRAGVGDAGGVAAVFHGGGVGDVLAATAGELLVAAA